MDLSREICDGNTKKAQKYKLLMEYMKTAPITSAKMIEDKKSMSKSFIFQFIYKGIFYGALGFGYAHILNVFRKMPKSYYVLPPLVCVFFSFFEYKEHQFQKYKIVDKYEYDLIKYYCK
ncbi:hypothetical protein SteCoe_15536 [Stentor coeruleus]|uniref:Transmembrane protein n=1 Tax=Stentor coeruleus TaxID=5963 RepID=A0A1R2C3J5_9CILI|nr:hypothetical protein SteCoe_15536 [Stentor coeruleus]